MSASGPRPDVTHRELARNEVDEVWSIDRSETVEHVYELVEGRLVLRPERWEMLGWPEGERELYAPMLIDCFERGGSFFGAFIGERLVGAAILDPRFMGRRGDRLQLKFLHVSQTIRGSGVGVALFGRAVGRAHRLGARRLYVSATNSQNTVDFYHRRGFRPTRDVDAHLFELEPEDIHLELDISDAVT